MSRTRLRVVLILLALILVAATIVAGLLTYWAEAAGSPASTPGDGWARQVLLAANRFSIPTGQPERPESQPL